MELQLERDKVQEELEREVKSLRKQMASMEQETERQRSSLEEQIATLQETLSEVSWVPSAKESFLSTCSSSSSHLLPTCRKRHCLPKGRRNYISWRPQPGVWSQGREDCYAVVLSSLISPMLNTNPHHQHILGLASLLRAWS